MRTETDGEHDTLQLVTLTPGEHERQDSPDYQLLVRTCQRVSTCTSHLDPQAQRIIAVTFHLQVRVLSGPPTLSNRTREYQARYTPAVPGKAGLVDLTNHDFGVDHGLHGRGLGSWIMQQIVAWARTWPDETRVKRIHTSPVDEREDVSPGNTARRDRLWTGVGFAFGPRKESGDRYSLPLTVNALQVHDRWHRTVHVEPADTAIVTVLQQSRRLDVELANAQRRAASHLQKLDALEAQTLEQLIPRVLVACVKVPLRLLLWGRALIVRSPGDKP